MCNEQKFFVCKVCGNMVNMIHDAGVKIVCCGKPMEELTPNTVEASQEKHIPVVEVNGNIVTVKIGSVAHPMVEEHHIEWVYLLTKEGVQKKCLSPGQEPQVTFALTDGDKAISAYEYCNIHGLWKCDI